MDLHRHTGNGEAKYHIHSLVRINTLIINPEFRYECRSCGARLKKKSGAMIDLKALNPPRKAEVSNREDGQ